MKTHVDRLVVSACLASRSQIITHDIVTYPHNPAYLHWDSNKQKAYCDSIAMTPPLKKQMLRKVPIKGAFVTQCEGHVGS